MKNKLSNKVVASFVVAGIVLSDGQIINAIDNNIEATTLSQNETNTENSTDQTNEIVGQSKFVDENGNVKVVNVYDGTTGEQYNPNERLVETANMVNFNCSKAGKTTKYIDYYTGQDGYLSKSSAADAAYLGMENGKVKFMVSGVVGLVDLNQVEIVTQGKYYASNYEVNSKGKLYHYISNNVNATGNQGNYNYVGEAPSYLSRGIEYYSYDGHYFYTNYEVMIKDYKNNVRSNSVNPNNPYYSYFQYLPLRSKTNYSAMQLTTYMNKKADSASSKLNDTGELFIKYQNQYGVNALMAMSFAALESGWGKSNIAIEKNNLFGLNATDANPNEDASKYATVEDCIRDFTANWMSKRYLNATYTNRFRGGYFGDKGSGIFGQYSSDPYEGEKCAAIAANMDAGISGADKNYYTIGIKDANMTTHTGLNVRKEGNTNSNVLYTTIKNPAYAFIVRKKEAVNGFYEIQSDSVLTNSRDDVSDTAEYDYNNNYAYVSNNYITIINDGNNIEYTPVIEKVEVIDITSEGYTVNCKVNDDVQIDRVMMPTWTEKNNQDDLNWYTASKNGDVYTVRVTTSNHKKESGKYNTHIYVYDNEGSVTKEELQIDVPEAKAPEIKDVKVSTPTRGGYTVTCTVESNSELTRVQMPTWTEKNNQDDLVWHDAKVEKIADRKYEVSYTVKTEDHNKESGKYITHIYAYDVNGKMACYEIGEINVPENQVPVIEEAYISDITSEGYTVNCKVSDDVQIDRVIVPTWTEVSGQDDMIWHEANYVDGIWQVKVIRKDHQYEYGKYTSHVYVYDDDGAYTVHGFDPVNLEEPDFIDGVPHIQDVKITDANDDGYTVTCKVTDDKQITKVLMPAWTYKNNQDELVWHEAKKISDDTYTCRIQRSDHKYEFGTYITHIYAYDIDGNEAKVELNYHNIVNTTVAQGWRYIDGQKYFFDDMGNIAGNMPSKKVIDVSLYNGVIDWETVARYGDIDGVIIRIVQHPNGSYIEDSQFANNLAGCRKYGIPFGVYIYDYSNNTADAFNEAELVTSILKKYNISSEELTYPVYFDMERNVHTTQQMTDNAAVFINQMSNHGYEANIYSYRSLLNEFLNSQYIWSKTSWLAAYTKTMGWENPHYHGKFGWQYTSSGVIPGINGSVDISCWFEI